MAYSIDLRKRVMDAVDNGMQPTEAAKLFKVARRTIYKWIDLLKETNSLAPKEGYQKGHSHKITDWDEFEVFAESNKKCTVKVMVAKWEAQNAEKVSESVIERALKKINFTSKKKLLGTSKLVQ